MHVHSMYMHIVSPCQACVPVDMTSSTSIKNHNEILRCFAVTSKCRDNVTSVYVLYMHIHYSAQN